MSVDFVGHPVVQERVFLLVDDAAEMVEVLPEEMNGLPDEALPVGRVRLPRRRVPRSDILAELLHVAGGKKPGRQLPVETQILIEAPHPDGILERFALAADHRFLGRSGYRNDVEIDLGRRGLVQAQLFLAKVPALLQRAEIEEVEHDRLLDLVGVVAREDDPGDVRLHEFDVVGGVGERIFPQQRPDEARVDVR